LKIRSRIQAIEKAKYGVKLNKADDV